MDSDTLNQFQSITNQVFSTDQAQQILQSHDWNLEASLIAAFDQNPQLPRALSTQSRNTVLNSNNSNMEDSIRNAYNQAFGNSNQSTPVNSEVPGAFPSPYEQPSPFSDSFSKLHKVAKTLLKGLITIVIIPLWVLYQLFCYLSIFAVEKIAPALNKITGLNLGSGRSIYSIRRSLDPSDNARRFIVAFDEEIGNTPANEASWAVDRPPFLECSYTQALYIAKRDCKWLLIYLQSDEHEDRAQFTKELLLSKQLLRFINQYDIMVWGGNVKESESFQVANMFKVMNFPFLGLLSLTLNNTGNNNTSSSTLSLVAKVAGISNNKPLQVKKIIKRFTKVYERYNPTVEAIRAQRNSRNDEQFLRAQQEEAYQRSLARDRARDEERNAARIRQEKERQWLLWRRETLRPEPSTELKGQYARIAIRTPDGTKITRRFDKDCSLEEIYAFAEFYLRPIPDEDITVPVSKPENYNHSYSFRLIQIMPREQLPVDESTRIQECEIVWPTGNLILENE
ncbi:UBX domain-containing protein 3 [Komagataella phaffii CBS 7435]|uniref:UBX (Ubiquitin regulatory X) domain-containing protein that interacts with Cdc48p n=2 Tax=Komagataella phaffii TaxID=460519 RepID=C4R8I2_KOMPG|nr:UBX (ubiquitin regulatory X) domain-containing protein that interacts with Cdc48p [Komagataella phaffii GS115]AOA64637.1 GQ67_05023T0 [Komagataella phaffii]CAH2450691.1 UBX domain-containing protein 3 [Komagataella phaffii CBS 7435]AOA69943.1 GQ68_05004T0 [Komagataella phaffii GS115]CAY71907.1 UBX (ubiquitin regulatory X) domain-containing protein that interacts with Cdc48p [Komagataella phaffii GS115]CCA40491.1 UBX domain-containing protein 3 [Komagataella phaffii CBS 7435]